MALFRIDTVLFGKRDHSRLSGVEEGVDCVPSALAVKIVSGGLEMIMRQFRLGPRRHWAMIDIPSVSLSQRGSVRLRSPAGRLPFKQTVAQTD
jgi:hypothetical protein